MLLLVLWMASAGPAHAAWFECRNFLLAFSPDSVLVSNGDYGGSFKTKSISEAGQVIYQKTLTASATCNTSDSGTWRKGSLTVGFGSVGRTFAGGGLALMPNGRPTFRVSNSTCAIDPGADNRLATSGPNYGSYYDNTSFTIGLAADHWTGCFVVIEIPVRVVGMGSSVVAGSPFVIHFNGSSWDLGFIAGDTVSISGSPINCAVSTSASTLTLPTVSQQLLKNAGDTAGVQPFSVTLTGCTALAAGSYLANATWSFTQGVNATTIANSATSPASDVEIQIRDANNTPVANNAVSTIASGITGGTHVAHFSARYYATGQATAGNVRGVVAFNMTYQ